MPGPGSQGGPSTVVVGRRAEQLACDWLEERGYTIVARNVRVSVGELDIVAQEGGDLVFVEVRSRSDRDHGGAEETVGKRKQAQLARVARAYIAEEQPRFTTCRFDVVAIHGEDDIELYVDAFRPGLD